MGERGRETVAADEPTIFAKPLFNRVVVEDGQSDGCLPNSAYTDESDGRKADYETNGLLNQLVTSKQVPRWWGRRFYRCTRFKDKMLGSSAV